MDRLLHDPVFLMWMVLTAGFLYVGIFAFCVWLEVRGIRGLAMTLLAVSLSVITGLLGVVRAGEAARISGEIVSMGIRLMFPMMLLSMGVLVDLWAADHNDHRSVTTITYQWWKRITGERFLKNDPRKPAQETSK